MPLVYELEDRKISFRIFAKQHAFELLEKNGIHPSDISREFISNMNRKFSIIVVGTSEDRNTLAFDLIDWGRQNSIRTVAIVDSAANYSYRFRGYGSSPLHNAPDFILVADKWTKRKFEEIGFLSSHIFVIGQIYQDALALKNRGALRKSLMGITHQTTKSVVFVSEISDGLNPNQYRRSRKYSLKGYGLKKFRTEIVIEEFIESINKLVNYGIKKPHLTLRLHPKEQGSSLGNLVTNFDFVSQVEEPLVLIQCADLVVGMTSMLLQEAHELGVETLSIVPDIAERDWLSATRDGLIDCAADSQKIFDLLKLKLETLGNKKRATFQERLNRSEVASQIIKNLNLIGNLG